VYSSALVGRAQAFDGVRRAHVLADVAELAGIPSARHFLAGQELDELLLAAGGIDRGHLGELQARVVCGLRRGFDGFHGLRLVALDRDDAARRVENVGQEQRAGHDRCRALAHQQVVAADVRLALRAVDDQRLAGNRCRELVRGWVHGAAQPDDAAGADRVELRRAISWPLRISRRQRLVAAVGLDHDARRRLHSVAAEHGPLLDRAHQTGGPRVHGGGRRPSCLCDELASAHALPNRDHGLGWIAAMLLERKHELRRHETAANRQRRRARLVGGQQNAAA
jgi:hypothetical protein